MPFPTPIMCQMARLSGNAELGVDFVPSCHDGASLERIFGISR